MAYTLEWQFLDSDTNQPIYSLPITITHQYNNANCFGSVNKYPPITTYTDSDGIVSQSYGSGACGSNQIKVSFAGDNNWLAISSTYNVTANRGGETTYTIYVTPTQEHSIVGTTTYTLSTTGTVSTSSQTGKNTAQATSTFLGGLSKLGASAQTDIEIIGIIAALIAVAVILIFIIKLKGGNGGGLLGH